MSFKNNLQGVDMGNPLIIHQQHIHTHIFNLDEYDTFHVNEDEAFFVPSEYLHHIEHLKKVSTTAVVIDFSHELSEAFNFSSAFSAMSSSVLDNTLQLPAAEWKDVIKQGEETVIGRMKNLRSVGHDNMYLYPNKYKLDLKKISPT
ncbi:unnamed protein product [Adineta steineri]|uniref:Uncharacterized protein n=1 Tax=Adineta steineri TaxID=433720 RepID=A0A819E0M5_9BILA|nr:unnamed protein product [Adineta steineri]CAF3842132.1 unnamed protein product [Adineta steineri]